MLKILFLPILGFVGGLFGLILGVLISWAVMFFSWDYTGWTHLGSNCYIPGRLIGMFGIFAGLLLGCIAMMQDKK